jgi:hypothetical protein
MRDEYEGKQPRLWTPATYRIEVGGYLDASWSDRLGGMRITICRGKNQATVTTLIGRLSDQAELIGILNSLYELHLPVLSVKTADDE